MKNIVVFALLFFLSHHSFAAEINSLTVNSDNDISYSRYAANGNDLMLWFYSEAGPQSSDIGLAKAMAREGTEVWLIDLFSSYFLPVALSSMDSIPASDISDLIHLAYKKTTKNVIPVGTGRAAILLLRAARELQRTRPDDQALTGLILLSPKFYTETPDPGQQGQLMPVVKNSNTLLFIIQPKLSPWFWKLDQTLPALQQGGSDVFFKVVDKVRDRFYFRPDADTYENSLSQQLPLMLRQAFSALKYFPQKSRAPSQLTTLSAVPVSKKKDKSLRPHKANPVPPALALNNISNQLIDLKDYNDTVVLINFWASWCPPCVHEMPSMQRLQNQYKSDQFIILGVNMAEQQSVIENFLKTKVNIHFPILMDTDGEALKRWQVFAFPTSYLIDKKGRIRYSLFGSIEWDKSEVISVINKLINE